MYITPQDVSMGLHFWKEFSIILTLPFCLIIVIFIKLSCLEIAQFPFDVHYTDLTKCHIILFFSIFTLFSKMSSNLIVSFKINSHKHKRKFETMASDI